MSMLPADSPIATVLKIGGKILDDEAALTRVLNRWVGLPGPKILVHGGGRAATKLAERLDLPQTLIDGRRVTDAETLTVAIMVYGGLINRTLVAALQARGAPATGIAGADLDLLRARKRSPEPVDYGWVGDITSVRIEPILSLLREGVTPVIAPLSHDGAGNLLNTNADTIAQEIACALSKHHPTRLVFAFEKPGVLRNENDPNSVISRLSPEELPALRGEGAISAGMIPKLENAFRALDRGVREVILGRADELDALIRGTAGTRCGKAGLHG